MGEEGRYISRRSSTYVQISEAPFSFGGMACIIVVDAKICDVISFNVQCPSCCRLRLEDR